MTPPTVEATDEAVRHALGLCQTLPGDWALIDFDSRYPRGRDPDRPTRSRPIDHDNPDAVPGDKDDPGIGDQRARRACSEAARHLQIAYRLAGEAVAIATRTPLPSGYTRPPRTAVDVRATVFTVEGRLRWLQGRLDAPEARERAHRAASAVIAAHAALRAVQADYDHVGEPTLDRRCWNCQRKVDPPRRECEACRKYRARAEQAIRNGRTVPHRLRPVPRYDDAHRAAARRQARLPEGDLDIAAPLPRGRYVDGGDWEQSTPHPQPDRSRAS